MIRYREPLSTEGRRVLVETLRLTRTEGAASAHEIASRSLSPDANVLRILSQSLGREFQDEMITFDQEERFHLAMEASRAGALEEVTRILDWREFERFAEDCVERAGFQTRRNVRIKDEIRHWEIDVVATKHPLLICFDCKHWARGSPSRFKEAIEHQKNATLSLLSTMTPTLADPTGRSIQELWALPVILTLFEPHGAIQDGGVLVSVQKLQDFLYYVAPFDPSLPFIHLSRREGKLVSRKSLSGKTKPKNKSQV